MEGRMMFYLCSSCLTERVALISLAPALLLGLLLYLVLYFFIRPGERTEEQK